MDQLEIKGLSTLTRIGVYDWEQQINQRLLIDITIPGNFSACEDDLSKTIDYALLCERVTQFVESGFFKLIETVADKLADLIKEEFKVEKVIVSVSKPHAIQNAGDIRVTVIR